MMRSGVICSGLAGLLLVAFPMMRAEGQVLETDSYTLPAMSVSAPYIDMLVNTSPLTTWGKKGAVGLQGSLAYNANDENGSNPNGYVPASTVAFKFNVGTSASTLTTQFNTKYGAGNWAISNPTLTFQYTDYANNSIFGGGAGTFETYWVANDSWAFGAGAASGNAYGSYTYVSGTDPVYATSQSGLQTWAGGTANDVADLGSTSYSWSAPPQGVAWATNSSGPYQGVLTDNLTADPLLISDIESASSGSDPNVSLYLVPSSTLGLTIFTGGSSTQPEPTLSFQVVSVPEPASAAGLILCGGAAMLRRRRGA